MKRLVLKIALLALIVSLLLALLVCLPWPAGETFRNIPKKHELVRGISGRKILVLGGSGVANGLSAGILERELPGYRAVNLGVNAGLGLEFNLNEVRRYLKPGDLVVLSPEYDNFEGGYRGGLQLLKAINVAPFTREFVSSERYRELLRSESLAFLRLKAQTYFDALTGLLSGASVDIDRWGDRVSPSARRDVSGIPFQLALDPAACAACIGILNEFDRYCRGRGARVVLSFPALPSVQYLSASRDLDRLYRLMIRDCSVLILHPPGEMVYEPALFDDSYYHLGRRGRELRSEKLARLIALKVLPASVR